jgi:S-adenosylmethionine synthetase
LRVQHTENVSQEKLLTYLARDICMAKLHGEQAKNHKLIVNPEGPFLRGGPAVSGGASGRHTDLDTYGTLAGNPGVALSGKDPRHFERSGTYFCRWVARRLLWEDFADPAVVHVVYDAAREAVLQVSVDNSRTIKAKAMEERARQFDYRPEAMVEQLDLLRPMYSYTSLGGHFGRTYLPWERDVRTEAELRPRQAG